MTECRHVWTEGMGRDEGFYHCALCYRCLSTDLLLYRSRALEGVAEAAIEAISEIPEGDKKEALRQALGTLEKGVGRVVYGYR
jgi:hypothetical protein